MLLESNDSLPMEENDLGMTWIFSKGIDDTFDTGEVKFHWREERNPFPEGKTKW